MGVSSQGRSFSVMRMAKVVLISVWLTVVSAAPQLAPADQAGVVSTVISTLQPAIAQAVANALRGQQTAPPPPPAPPAPPPVSTDNLASYQYEYKIASDQTQTYISQQERRDGNQVSGVYSYVDPTGAIVTVYYEAGEGGYQETRERQEGAVQIRAQPAGAAPTPGAGAGAGGVDVESLIARVLAALQPAIEQTVASYL